jgi:TRAP-type C4-dicarboxylate transport system permease large subunit
MSMLKGWMRDVTLWLQAKSGVTPALFISAAIVAIALPAAFGFLCVAAYLWLLPQLGAIFAALLMAGIFVVIALIAAIVAAVSRRNAKRRAMLERAARAQASNAWLLDPKIIGIAVQAGRTLGWERVIPVALVGFLAAHWLLRKKPDSEAEAESETDPS